LNRSTAPRVRLSSRTRRIIGHVVGEPGATLICVGSLHGNEPAGVNALQRVFAQLDRENAIIHGTFVGIAGNLSALAEKRRYIHHDLNRCWSDERIKSVTTGPHPPDRCVAEDMEVIEILAEVEQAVSEARGDVYFLDLHTTSGDSPSFATVADTLRNRAFALRFPVPTILGLEEHLDGTFLEYMNNRGFVTMGFEGGQHHDPVSTDRVEECIWVGLTATGIMPDNQLPQTRRARSRLATASRLYPQVLEVRYRHAVKQEDDFVMEPGYASFHQVRAGELLAHDRSGPLTAFEDGRVLLPLYQTQGEDGYFLMREFSSFWLRLSAVLRLVRLDAVLHWLPGVQRSSHTPHTLVINRRIARWFALQVFHLLGYRKRRTDGETLVVTRRPERI